MLREKYVSDKMSRNTFKISIFIRKDIFWVLHRKGEIIEKEKVLWVLESQF